MDEDFELEKPKSKKEANDDAKNFELSHPEAYAYLKS